MKKLLSFLFVLIVTLGLLVGCGSGDSGDNDASNKTKDEETNTEQTEETGQSDFPVTLTDAIDKEVTIEEKPERIVSLIPSNTEIAFALGLDEEVVGVSDHDNYPEAVQEKEKIGGMELNIEKIIGLKPDLVLAHASSAHNAEAGLQQLRDAGINVFVVADAQNVDQTYESIQQIGDITGTTEKAEDIVGNMKDEFASLEEKAETVSEEDRKSVFFEVSPAPEIFTAGKNTFFDNLLQIIHAENAAKEQDGWVQIDPESIVKLNPDVIVTTYGHYEENAEESVLSRDGWDSVTAIKNEAVYDIHSDLISRPGPRLVEGAKELAKVVYPDVFAE
ncbi:ABC transporter substrate-binding protein [Virgibacillus halodenitrificans]|uniref:ABC transporter substrate-binding protein n=1 Tax=Virgibacillus halodenitrificans TaxID=1482 RepID=A0AAC9NKF9_VIRHA|nr:ABC transporter substrate-binding protein [Virgibacillus halodenitrificans]APC47634.1 ABC transporter substrate-binding protein [Virgibacillus halodenitrificans]MCJ0930448.1 ABC transporter substrate-binding protein [Virgibacillus halodenitrificans]